MLKVGDRVMLCRSNILKNIRSITPLFIANDIHCPIPLGYSSIGIVKRIYDRILIAAEFPSLSHKLYFYQSNSFLDEVFSA